MTNAAAITNFEQLYKKHYRIVAATVFKFRLGEDVADNLIQETFIKAWNKMDTLENADAFGSWVSMIARNLCLNHLKKVKKHQHVSVAQDVSAVEDQSGAEVVLTAADESVSASHEHAVSTIRNIIKGLKPSPRTTVAQAFYLEGQSVKEICETHSMKQNTVLSHLRRFRESAAETMQGLVKSGVVVA